MIRGLIIMFGSLALSGAICFSGLVLFGIPASWQGYLGCVLIVWGIAGGVKTLTSEQDHD